MARLFVVLFTAMSVFSAHSAFAYGLSAEISGPGSVVYGAATVTEDFVGHSVGFAPVGAPQPGVLEAGQYINCVYCTILTFNYYASIMLERPLTVTISDSYSLSAFLRGQLGYLASPSEPIFGPGAATAWVYAYAEIKDASSNVISAISFGSDLSLPAPCPPGSDYCLGGNTSGFRLVNTHVDQQIPLDQGTQYTFDEYLEVGIFGANASFAASMFPAVPEPGTLLVLGCGLGALALRNAARHRG